MVMAIDIMLMSHAMYATTSENGELWQLVMLCVLFAVGVFGTDFWERSKTNKLLSVINKLPPTVPSIELGHQYFCLYNVLGEKRAI